MGTYSVGESTAGEPGAIDAIETTFGLERDLQASLRSNIQRLKSGLQIAATAWAAGVRAYIRGVFIASSVRF